MRPTRPVGGVKAVGTALAAATANIRSSGGIGNGSREMLAATGATRAAAAAEVAIAAAVEQ